MTDSFEFVIRDFEVKPKARARVFWREGKIQKFTPTASLEKHLAWTIIAEKMKIPDFEMICSICGIDIVIFSRTTLKGDCDNYQKLIFDAIEKAKVVQNDRLFRDCRIRIFDKSYRKEKNVLDDETNNDIIFIKIWTL